MAHTFEAGLVWSGTNQSTAASYQNTTRAFEIAIDGKPVLKTSAPSVFPASMHTGAHAACFIGNSMNFPVRNQPAVLVV